VILVIAGSLQVAVCAGQRGRDEATRKLWNTEFLEQRPQALQARRAVKTRKNGPGAANKASVPASSLSYLGLTVWRLRAARTDDDQDAILISNEKETSRGWIPEAVSTDVKLSAGDRVRLSVETSHSGYLYVIDREEFADGHMGEPSLIAPVTRIRGGNNQVTAGRITEIPARDDSVPYFTLERSRPDHSGEAITFLLTPKRLNLAIGRNAVALPENQVKQWERDWSKAVELHNDYTQTGRVWSKVERASGTEATRKLTQKDPLPLTLYRVAATASEPLLVTVRLQIAQ